MKVKGDIQVRPRDHILMLTTFDYVHTCLPIMQHTFML
jgi:hypothetical protein